MAALSASGSCASEIVTDGPILNIVNKRLRALRKKLNRVNQLEESLSQGRTLNKEQEEMLHTRPSLLAGIDELEKLRLPLSQAVDQEIELALEKNKRKPDVVTTEIQNEANAAVEAEAKGGDDGVSAVSDLIKLLYFASVFDVKTLMRAHDNMLTRTHERNCCLTYDYVTDDDAAGDPLKEWDLDFIATLGGLLTSRPVNSSLSHKNALQKCVEHARLWLAQADQPIEPNSSITYAGLREKLGKIMASDYFTTAPEIKAQVEVAAAAGNYTSFQVPGHGSVIPQVASDPIEGLPVEQQKEEEHSPTSPPNNETYDDETGPAEQLHQGASEVENVLQVQAHTEQTIPDAEISDNSKEPDLKVQQQQTTWKPYQNYRGGCGGSGNHRGGYGNSRGGRGNSRGGYQNGRSQYHEQAGGYYPRNNSHYRGRGGRGMGSNYSHYAPAGNADQAQSPS